MTTFLVWPGGFAVLKPKKRKPKAKQAKLPETVKVKRVKGKINHSQREELCLSGKKH